MKPKHMRNSIGRLFPNRFFSLCVQEERQCVSVDERFSLPSVLLDESRYSLRRRVNFLKTGPSCRAEKECAAARGLGAARKSEVTMSVLDDPISYTDYSQSYRAGRT